MIVPPINIRRSHAIMPYATIRYRIEASYINLSMTSLLLNKRNISNLLIIRNASVEHVLGQRRTDVAKSSGGAAHFLAIGRDHPLRGRDAAGEQECQNDVFVHSDTPLLRSRYSKAASRNLSN
jgi:hypothetical protein